jgi:hypothetical protein
VIFKIKNNISWYLKACRRCAFAPLRVFAGPEDVISPFCKKRYYLLPLYRPRYPPPRRVKQGLVMRRQDFRSVENYFIFCMQLCKKQWLCAEFKPGIATGRSCAVKTARENRRCGNTPCSVKKSLIFITFKAITEKRGDVFP